MSGILTKTYNGLKLSYQNGVGGVTQQYQVDNLTIPTDDPASLFQQALNVIGISYTSPHPSIAGLYAASFDAWLTVQKKESVSKASVTFEIGFKTPTFIPFGGVRVELSGSNSQTILNRWPNGPEKGSSILVAYNPDKTVAFADQISPTEWKRNASAGTLQGSLADTVEIPIESPNAILQFSRTEFVFPKANYSLRKHLNSKSWLGFAPETVLFREMNAVNMVGVGTIIPDYWMCKYVFEVAPDPTYWAHIEFFRDRFTGKLLPNVDITDGTGNGYVVVNPYGDPVDLNQLNFDPNLLS